MSLFYNDFFWLTVPKKFVGEPFSVSLLSGIEKTWRRGGYQDFTSNIFSHSAENFRRGILYCCINFGYRKSLDKMGGGVSRFSVESFLSHSAENYLRGILYCCINFGYRKSLDKRGGEKYQDFPSKFFCLTVPKTFVGEVFTVVLISDSEKVYGQEGGGEYQDFPSKIFCLTVPKKFVGESFSNSINSGVEKCYG